MSEERLRPDTEASVAPAQPQSGTQRARTLEHVNQIRELLERIRRENPRA